MRHCHDAIAFLLINGVREGICKRDRGSWIAAVLLPLSARQPCVQVKGIAAPGRGGGPTCFAGVMRSALAPAESGGAAWGRTGDASCGADRRSSGPGPTSIASASIFACSAFTPDVAGASASGNASMISAPAAATVETSRSVACGGAAGRNSTIASSTSATPSTAPARRRAARTGEWRGRVTY